MGEENLVRRWIKTVAILCGVSFIRVIVEHPALLGWDTYGFAEYTSGFIVAARHWASPTPSSTGDGA